MAARTSNQVKRPKNPPKSNRAKSSSAAAQRSLSTLAEHQISTGRAVLIHGHTGAGKTVLAIHKAPRPLLVLDCDTGLDSVYGTADDGEIQVWGPPEGEAELDWESMDEFRNYLLSGPKMWEMPYEVVVVDNVTAGQKPVVVWGVNEAIGRLAADKRAARDPDIPSQQDWGKIYRVFDKWIRDVKSVKRFGVDVIFTAGTREWMDQMEGYSRLMPNLEGAERNQIATHMDAVGFLESDEEGRRLSLAPSGAMITKVRLPVSAHGRKLNEIKDPDFNKMMRVVKSIVKEEAKPKAANRKTTTTTTRKRRVSK